MPFFLCDAPSVQQTLGFPFVCCAETPFARTAVLPVQTQSAEPLA